MCNLVVEYVGMRCIVRYCERPSSGADPATWQPPSWCGALSHLQQKKHDSIWARMLARRELLADHGQLRSPDHWNTEGELPDQKHFYAIKVDKIRAYGWFSTCHRGVFYISHFSFKSGQKLALEDIRRVHTNWREIERQPE